METLFLLSLMINGILFSWNIALLDSRYFWRKKWEDEINK